MQISGSGFVALATATFWLDDRTDVLGATAVASDGSFQAQLPIPSPMAAGLHTLGALVPVAGALPGVGCYEEETVAISVLNQP